MPLLRDSSQAANHQARYEQIWNQLQLSDEKKADKILTLMEYKLLPRRLKIRYKLQSLQTHWIWIIPVSVLLTLSLLYVLFLWAALIVE